jgi:hypothetical protein
MANYRDDRDALRNKADVLAGELEGTKAELEQVEAENEAKDAEIARLRKLAGERPAARRNAMTSPLFLAIMAGALSVAGGLTFFLMGSRRTPVPALPAQVTVPARVDPALPSVPMKLTKVRFEAKVAKVTGRTDVKVGEACAIEVASVGGDRPFQELTVACGAAELYRLSNAAGTVMSMSRWNLAETAGGYSLEFEDVGQRSSDARAQTAIATAQKAGRIFTDGAVPTEVTLEIAAVGKPHD